MSRMWVARACFVNYVTYEYEGRLMITRPLTLRLLSGQRHPKRLQRNTPRSHHRIIPTQNSLKLLMILDFVARRSRESRKVIV